MYNYYKPEAVFSEAVTSCEFSVRPIDKIQFSLLTYCQRQSLPPTERTGVLSKNKIKNYLPHYLLFKLKKKKFEMQKILQHPKHR